MERDFLLVAIGGWGLRLIRLLQVPDQVIHVFDPWVIYVVILSEHLASTVDLVLEFGPEHFLLFDFLLTNDETGCVCREKFFLCTWQDQP